MKQVSPLEADVMIGLAKVEDEERDIHEKILGSSLTSVDKSMSFIN